MRTQSGNNKLASSKENTGIKAAADALLAKVDEAANNGEYETILEINEKPVMSNVLKQLDDNKYTYVIKQEGKVYKVACYWGPSKAKSSVFYKKSSKTWVAEMKAVGWKTDFKLT